MGLSNYIFLKRVFSGEFKNKRNGNMSVEDGCIIQSYATDIAYFNMNLDLCIINDQYYSPTTAHHKSYVRQFCSCKNVFYLNFGTYRPGSKNSWDLVVENIIDSNVSYIKKCLDAFFSNRKSKCYTCSSGYLNDICSIKKNLTSLINYADNNLNVDINKNKILMDIDNICQTIISNIKPRGLRAFIKKNQNEKLKAIVDRCKSILSMIHDAIKNNERSNVFKEFPSWDDNNDDIISEIKKYNVYKALRMLINKYEAVIATMIHKQFHKLMCECLIFEHPGVVENVQAWTGNTILKNYQNLRVFVPIFRTQKRYYSGYLTINQDHEIEMEQLKKSLMYSNNDIVTFNGCYCYYYRKDLEDYFNEKNIKWAND